MIVPWARPRFELTLLALIAVAALSSMDYVSSQDVSRLCLTRALEHGRVTVDDCIGSNFDRAERAGHLYSDKAPGMSVLAIPAAAAVRLGPPDGWTREADPSLWAVRVLSGGIAFLACAFLLGRVAEGLAPGWGDAALVAFGLGTLVTPLAATTYGHVTAGTLAFGAFLLAWDRRPAAAGLAAGAAVAVEYPTALAGVVIAAYVAMRGVRPLARYAAAAAAPLAALAAYDWWAFGSPFHLSYRYVANRYAGDQSSGFFGIATPRLHAVEQVFVGRGGLLVLSPVVIAAAAGLVLLAGRHRREAAVCAVVTLLFVIVNIGYFLPYGGISPGPRFLVPALPFLAVGLAPAFERYPATTRLLTAASVVAIVATTLTWHAGGTARYGRSIWAEIVQLGKHGGSSRIVTDSAKNILVYPFTPRARIPGDAIGTAAAAAAFLAGVARPRRR
jgi:hypothetical protein